MAWTDPKIWVTGSIVTAAELNTHVRDNLNALIHPIVRKPSDESITSSTVFQPDDHLILPVASNGVYRFRFDMIYTAGLGRLKVQFTFPTGGTITATCISDDAGSILEHFRWHGTSSPAAEQNTEAFSEFNGSQLLQPIDGVYINGSTAGNVVLEWAQNASNATATVMKANSALWATQIA